MKLFLRETAHLSSVIGLLITVIGITMLAMVDPVESCHRKVEYHHFYKKQPSKGHGWGWGWNGNGYQGQGHGHGNGHKGHGHAHGNGHGHKGYGKGWKSHGQGYGHMEQKGYGGHKGYGHEQKGGHQGYGHGGAHGHGKGHGSAHKGHGSHEGYGEQKGHGGHEGYGEQKGHGGHEGYGEHKGYGGHQEHGHGHKGGHGGHDEHQDGHGYGNAGYESGYQMSTPNHKGMKYKHSSYEMSTYGDQGGHRHGGQHNNKGGYNDANHNSKGYGYSGPYPNTEYSSNVVSSVNPPATAEADDSLSSLDAADAADYIRSLSSSNVHNPSYISAPILVDTLPLSSSISTSPSNREADIAAGNFDLNLEFNSDLPGPFRRNGASAEGRRGVLRKRKKISSTFKATGDPIESRSSESDDLKS